MTKLIQNFLDIIMLRKGPDIIPSSWLVFLVAFSLLIISSSSVILLIESPSNQSPLINLLAYCDFIFIEAANSLIPVSPNDAMYIAAATTHNV